ncbi:MAG: DUF1190 domain-containing protein [Hyphomicrobiaceae bacterium]|nr:DUF1190 domain-containing protein [Hyphomicrobiaceae bacterium]
MRTRQVPLAFVIMATVSLAACGQARPKGPPAPTGIFTSASDCAAAKKADFDDCRKAIEMALATHEKSSKSYISERLCEIDAGPGRCEKLSKDQFRPRLAAFLVAFSTPVKADPLYAPKKPNVLGYVTAGNAKTYLTIDETLIVTPAAKQIAYGFADRDGRGSR